MFTNNRYCNTFGVLAIAVGSTLAAQPAASSNFPIGTYASSGLVLTFDSNGQFRVRQDGAMKVEGKYVVRANTLQLVDDNGPWACADAGSKSGTYHWRADKGTLTFSKDDDACKERVDSLTPHPWKKQD